MEKVEYSDIVFLEKIRDVKTTIRNSGFRLDFEKAYHVDRRMRDVIDRLFDEDTDDPSLVELYKKLDKKIDRRVSDTLVFYYFSLYQDNLDLLRRILQEGIEFYDENDHACLELLDQDFIKYFGEEQYIFLLKNCREEMLSFYNHVFSYIPLNKDMDTRKKLIKELNELSEALFSTERPLEESERKKLEARLAEVSSDLKQMITRRYSDEERDDLCRKFAEIMTRDPFICKTGGRNEYNNEEYYHDLLNPDVIKIFGVEGLLRLNGVQKERIADARMVGTLERLKSLFEKYPEYSSKLRLDPDLLRVFTDEELVAMPEEDIPLFEKASLEEIPSRFKRVLASNPSLRHYPELIRKDIFEELTEEEISGLSDGALRRIHNLVIQPRYFDKEAKYHIRRGAKRIAKTDKIFQKVKKNISRI